MLFFFLTCVTVAYVMTDRCLTELFLNTYRMAFAGSYEKEMFFAVESGNPINTGSEYTTRFFLFCAFGIIIMVALNNIFIGMMANTYDHYQTLVSALFVRQRLIAALEHFLLMGITDQEGKILWVCRCRTGEDSGVDSLGEVDFSLRSGIIDGVQGLDKKLDEVLEQGDRLERDRKHKV